ncbi:hypothetical protein [Niastella populi]|uniref:Uncharacterized protein n=1 Tax=Niastella populi TaxID=550983 RepID=A0A1V9GAM7_9BACT|nr:hypothetical protein [Niastella populi]OQP67612.1 hypothetical protein A4R26_12430 [Niastella populi]
MQKTSLRKLSILGLVLMAASAVTAAILPANNKEVKDYTPGSLTNSSGGGLTCEVDSAGGIDASCNITTESGTTANFDSSDEGGNSTAGANDVDS